MHYYKKNIGDYHKKAGRLSMLEHGAYTLLLDACYDRERFPSEDEAMDWAWARTDAERDAVKFVLRKFFTLIDGVYVQDRVAEEVAKYHSTATTNARIAKEREENRRNKPKPYTKRARSVNESSPDSHEAPPNQEPLTINQEPLTNNQIDSVAKATGNKSPSRSTTPSRPDEVSESLWADFLAIRKAKRAPLTTTALEGIRREAEKAGLHLVDAIAYCCEAGWQGFKADWYAGREGSRGHAMPGGRTMNKQEALEARNGEVAKAWVADMKAKMAKDGNHENS